MSKERDQQYSQDTKLLANRAFAAIVGVLFSRTSGVIRQIIVNATFGANYVMDAFNAAFRLPNGLRDLFADGALSAAFIKVLVDAREQGIEEEQKLISIIIGFFIVLTGLIAILCAIFSLHIMEIISNHKFNHAGTLILASNLFKILAFYLPITMLNAVAMASLGVLGKTFRATNASLFLSVGMIAGSLFFAPLFKHFGVEGIFGLALGAMLGALSQLFYQFVPLLKLNLILWPNFKPKEWLRYKPLHNVLWLMAPRVIGQGALTIALIINTMFAIQVGQGVLTYIVTAVMIVQVPIGLFGVATSFAALPTLTQSINEKNYQKFSALLVDSLQTSLWLAILTTAAFAIFIVPFYHILFEHGKINYQDTVLNCLAVCSYSTGVVFSSGSKILLNAFYAVNDTKQIIYNAIIYLFLNALLSFYLAPRYGIIGLGLSYSTSTAMDFFLNYFFLQKKFYQLSPQLSCYSAGGHAFFLRVVCFAIASYFTSLCGVSAIKFYWGQLPTITNLEAFIFLGVGGILFAIFCWTVLFFFGPINLQKLMQMIKFKLIKR